MLRSVDGSSTIASFSTPGPVTIDTLESETITSNSAIVKTLNYFSTGASSLPATLGNVPFSIDMISMTMANNMAATHKPFGVQQITSLDLTSANPELQGFRGGFTDGRYGYFVPNSEASGLIARVDLQNFTVGGVTPLDLTSANAGLKGFNGGFTDGRYGYFVPNINFGISRSGLIARVDLQNFTVGGVTPLDLTSANAGLKGFSGGFTDGRYGYFVPNNNGAHSGLVARVDLQNFTVGGVTPLDLTASNADLKGFSGGFTDGRYGYFIPFYSGSGSASGLIARVDLQNFADGGVTTLNLASANADLKGFQGGFTDGRYGYFVPYYNGSFSGLVARVDLQNFAVGGVTPLNLTSANASLKGFWGGFTDGRYGYFVPNFNGIFDYLVARVQITVPPYLYNGSI